MLNINEEVKYVLLAYQSEFKKLFKDYIANGSTRKNIKRVSWGVYNILSVNNHFPVKIDQNDLLDVWLKYVNEEEIINYTDQEIDKAIELLKKEVNRLLSDKITDIFICNTKIVELIIDDCIYDPFDEEIFGEGYEIIKIGDINKNLMVS